MNNLEKKNYYNSLLTLYSNQLTKFEKEDMLDYYTNDLSLSEIANNRNVSRNAVYLSIRQGEKKLEELETRLSLLSKLNKIIDELEKTNKLDDISNIKENISKIIEELKNGI